MPTSKPLSPFQTQLLADIAEGKRTFPPDGYPRAGADASRWWKSTEILCKAGLLQRHDFVRVSIPGAKPALPPDAFEERITGKTAAYERAEQIRQLGRQCVTIHRSGAHYLVRVSAAKVAA